MRQLIAEIPVPVFYLNTPTDWQSLKEIDPVLNSFWLTLTKKLSRCPFFRCVSFDRIQTIFRTGVDVEPSWHHIYVTSSYDKALEYGSAKKVMLVYDPEYLHKTCRVVPTTTPLDELHELSSEFPTRFTSKDQRNYFFSRLPENDTAVGSPYENEYGRWIPGDPFEALKAVILIGQFSEEELSEVSASYPNNSGCEI